MPRTAKNDNSERQRKLRNKFEGVIEESMWPFLSCIIMEYNNLSVLRQHEMGRRYSKMYSCFAEEGKKKFTYNHDRLMRQAVMSALSRHYNDLYDKSLQTYIESYMRSKSAKNE